MRTKSYITFLKTDYIFLLIILVSLISALRSLIVPLQGDELTYNRLAGSVLSGCYQLDGGLTPIAPITPLILAFFKSVFGTTTGVLLNKLFNVFLFLVGCRYWYLILEKLQLSSIIRLCIITLVVVNPISVVWFSTLYPEAMVFFALSGFLYYLLADLNKTNLIKTLFFFLILVFTRYVYAVLGLLVLYRYIEYLKDDFGFYKKPLFKYSIIALIPLLFWGSYLLKIESEVQSKINYFNRFDVENPLWYNIKCGLGLEKHYRVSRISGIPAFITLFVPITGFRNYFLSLILIIAFISGYVQNRKNKMTNKIFIATLLVLLGYIIAGTGFSRYWVSLLPAFFLGYYLLFKSSGLKEKWFVYMTYGLSFIYIVNEIRLDILVISKYI